MEQQKSPKSLGEEWTVVSSQRKHNSNYQINGYESLTLKSLKDTGNLKKNLTGAEISLENKYPPLGGTRHRCCNYKITRQLFDTQQEMSPHSASNASTWVMDTRRMERELQLINKHAISSHNNWNENNTKRLEIELSTSLEPEKLVQNLLSMRKLLINELKYNVNSVHYTRNIISMLAKACQSKNDNAVSELLSIVHDSSNFLNNHMTLFVSLCSRHMVTIEDIVGLTSSLDIINSLLTLLPTLSIITVTEIINKFDIIRIKHGKDLRLSQLFIKLYRVEQMRAKMMKAIDRRWLKETNIVVHSCKAMEEHDNSFREISVIPTEHLLQNVTALALRQNRIFGGYNDIEEYLGVQFRLLHEDFLRPLRNGIQAYREFFANSTVNNCRHTQPFMHDDLWIYEGVYLKDVKCDFKGVTWLIQLNIERLSKSKWHKRLLFGNLVCFSNDNFNRIIFGTVSNSNEESLQKGELNIYFDRQNVFKFIFEPNQQMTMIEPSSSYFIAYKSVLESLQKIQKMPFDTYLITVKLETIKAPAYLCKKGAKTFIKLPRIKNGDENLTDCTTVGCNDMSAENDVLNHQVLSKRNETILENTCQTQDGSLLATSRNKLFDFGHLIPCVEEISINFLPQHATWGKELSVPRLIYRERLVDVLEIGSWPAAGELKLDDSQYRALQDAITKELSVIQGPPGTGKTFIGLKVVQLLLQNKHVLQSDDEYDRLKGPILVVCYTNHALDQFLEGILAMNGRKTKLIRVGNRSKSSLLGPYSLKEHRKLNLNIDQLKKLRLIESQLKQELEKLSNKNKIFDYNVLKPVITFEQRRSLLSWAPSHEDCIIGHWLCMDDVQSEMNSIKMCNSKLIEPNTNVKQPVESNSVNKELLTEVCLLEEMRREQEERLIEEDADNFFEVHLMVQRNEKKIRKREKTVSCRLKNGDRQISAEKCKQTERLQEQTAFLNANDFMADETEAEVDDVWKLNQQDRWRLYSVWIRHVFDMQSITLRDHFDKYEEEIDKKRAAQSDADMRVLQTADIVGMTTTGAAYYRHILQQVRPKIIIVEEAAEILEAHVVTVMSPFTEHLILIGDHQQLRPKVTVEELGSDYHLDISLFERLIENGIGFVQLKNQHRMRPEIAALICPLFYKDLENAENVKKYNDIKGMRNNVFFCCHNLPESSIEGSKSYCNEHEAEFVKNFYYYLREQGYSESKITILTPYVGQLFCLRRAFARFRKEENVSKIIKVIDDYQGEKNDIIIVSLVRSNAKKKIGFLKHKNRACVLLSRAKMGLFLIGDADHFKSSSVLWKSIISILEEHKCIGNFLPLQCQYHPDMPIQLSYSNDDFMKQMRNTACVQRCNYQLTCGHLCKRICHKDDRAHRSSSCLEQCSRLCKEGLHTCQKLCAEQCGDCYSQVQKTFKNCGHVQLMYCYENPNKVKCLKNCERKCELGHLCGKKCYQKCPPCMQEVEKIIPSCSHLQKIPCFANPHETLCKQSCEKKCDSGHICKKRCAEECGPCIVKVEKIIPRCLHKQMVPCNKPPEKVLCEFVCEKLLPLCGHMQPMNCYKNPADAICQHQCTKMCPNGHACLGLCSETCPPCNIKMNKIDPKCGHEQYVNCCEQPKNIRCIHSCEKQCFNGHPCRYLCYDTPCPPCNTVVNKIIPSCGHVQEAHCHRDATTLTCINICERPACSFGHKCPKQCSEPCEPCMHIVKKKLPNCNHYCEIPCSESTKNYQCQKPCERMCEQSHKCPERCYVKCGPCKIKVTKTLPVCGHVQKVACGVKLENIVCEQRCVTELKCGHQCANRCGDLAHTKPSECKVTVKKILKCGHEANTDCCENISNVLCRKLVNVQLKCGHEYNSHCYEKEKLICKKNKKIVLSCDHVANIPCNETYSYKCKEKIARHLPCGHEIQMLCSDKSNKFLCTVQVEVLACKRCQQKKIVPCHKKGTIPVEMCSERVPVICKNNKNHRFLAKCYEKHDNDIQCPKMCESLMRCSHTCTDYCENCVKNGSHLICTVKSEIDLPCGHSSWRYCFGFTLSCENNCEFYCMHFNCEHSCSDECAKCCKPCDWSCDHYSCTKRCSEICDRPPCNKPCPKMLPCKHFCMGYCGEPCPKGCFYCDARFFRRMELFSKTKVTACSRMLLLQPCGHIVDAEFMKRHVNKYVEQDERGYRSLSPLTCPLCDKMILNCPRYSYAIKKYINAINEMRTLIKQQLLFASLSNELSKFNSLTKPLQNKKRRHIQNILCSLKMASKLKLLLNQLDKEKILPHPVYFLLEQVGKYEERLLCLAEDLFPMKHSSTTFDIKNSEFKILADTHKSIDDINDIKSKLIKYYLEKKLIFQNKDPCISVISVVFALNTLCLGVISSSNNCEPPLKGEPVKNLQLKNEIIRQDLDLCGSGTQNWKICKNGL